MTRNYTPQELDSAPVATFLTTDERLRVDAAGTGLYRTRHHDSVEQILRNLQTEHVRAVLVSVNMCSPQGFSRVSRIIREYPRVPTVAVVSQYLPRTAQAVLLLGRCGVRTLVDIRDARGWQELRGLLDHSRTGSLQRIAIGGIESDLGTAPAGCLHFFYVLFDVAPRVNTVKKLADELEVVPSTLMSRFFRFNLPAPKRYLTLTRLVYAAQLFENPGLSVAAVSNQLDFSSPQSFGRHVYATMGLTPSQFRDTYDGEGMLEHYRRALVTPYVEVLRAFDPLSPT